MPCLLRRSVGFYRTNLRGDCRVARWFSYRPWRVWCLGFLLVRETVISSINRSTYCPGRCRAILWSPGKKNLRMRDRESLCLGWVRWVSARAPTAPGVSVTCWLGGAQQHLCALVRVIILPCSVDGSYSRLTWGCDPMANQNRKHAFLIIWCPCTPVPFLLFLCFSVFTCGFFAPFFAILLKEVLGKKN